MNVRCVRVRPGVGPRLEAHTPRVDDSIAYGVVRGWVVQHRVQEGDAIYALGGDVDGVNQAVPVWVVVGVDGLVRSVSEPPVGPPGAVWPALVAAVTEPTQREG